jgi:hypothetical protein
MIFIVLISCNIVRCVLSRIQRHGVRTIDGAMWSNFEVRLSRSVFVLGRVTIPARVYIEVASVAKLW